MFYLESASPKLEESSIIMKIGFTFAKIEYSRSTATTWPARLKRYKSCIKIVIVICSRIIVVWVSAVIVHHNYRNYNCENYGISAPSGGNCIDNCDNCGDHDSLCTILFIIIIVNGYTQLFAQL